jgi:CzcA family heavy metal efflux pump
MLEGIIRTSLDGRGAVPFAAAALALAGGWWLARAPLDAFPEFAPPQVAVQTEAPGFTAEQVELLVTVPLETAVRGATGLREVRSQSAAGLSVLTVVFRDGTDVLAARQQVGERLAAAAPALPRGVSPPRMTPLMSSTGKLLTVGLTSPALSPAELRTLVRRRLLPRLMVEGVAAVNVFGGEERRLEVRIRPERLAAAGLAPADVVDAAAAATGIRGAGFAENPQQRIALRSRGEVRTADDLRGAVIRSDSGRPVTLGDVAEVVDGAAPKVGDAAVDGRPGVVLVISKQQGADSLEVTARLERELESVEREVLAPAGVTLHRALFRQADFIESAVGNVGEALGLGAVFVAVVLFVFQWNWRTSLISVAAIPLSLIGGAAVLRLMGLGINTLTLGGLAIAVGEVVDDAVIDVENVHRRLRENRDAVGPLSVAAVILRASMEVRSSVVYATLLMVLVCTPVLLLSGLAGRLFAPLAWGYLLAVSASLLVALTVTPAMCLLLLRGHGGSANETAPVRWARRGYGWFLSAVMPRWPWAAAAALAAVAFAGAAAVGLRGEFLPALQEDHVVIHVAAVPGTSLPETMRIGRRIARELLAEPTVLSVAQQAGRAELGEDTWDVNYSEFEVRLRPAPDAEAAERRAADLARRLSGIAGVNVSVKSFLAERIEETIAGVPGDYVVKLYGENLARLERSAERVAKSLSAVPGASDVRMDAVGRVPEIEIRVRPPDAARYGLRTAEVLETVRTFFQGAAVAQVYDESVPVDVVVLLDPAFRGDPAAISRVPINTPSGGRVELGRVADVERSEARPLVQREGGRRRMVVYCSVTGRDEEAFAADAGAAVRAALEAASGDVQAVATGRHEARAAAVREMLAWSAAVLVAVAFVLRVALGSLRSALLVLANIPFALVGGVGAVLLSGGTLNVGALVGFVTLFGITARNGIMMVSHWNQLFAEEGVPWGPDLVRRGAEERLVPILMTSAVLVLGLLPLVLGGGKPGAEIEGPMAVVILGGTVSSVALNLVLLPSLMLRFGRPPARQVVAQAPPPHSS